MTTRSPLGVFFLVPVTMGIYSLVWYVKTKEEMKLMGADIPSAWMLIIPIVNLSWIWKYCKGVKKVTNNSMSAGSVLLRLLFLGPIGMALIQSAFNKIK